MFIRTEAKELLHKAVYFSQETTRALLEDEYSKLLYDFILENRGGSVNIYQYGQLAAIRNREAYWADVPLPEHPNCAIVDCGAYEGDSIQQILETITPSRCTYYALEPDKHVFPQLLETQQRLLSDLSKPSG